MYISTPTRNPHFAMNYLLFVLIPLYITRYYAFGQRYRYHDELHLVECTIWEDNEGEWKANGKRQMPTQKGWVWPASQSLDPGSLFLHSTSNTIYSVKIRYRGPKVWQAGQDYSPCDTQWVLQELYFSILKILALF